MSADYPDDTVCSAVGCGFSPGTCENGAYCDPLHPCSEGECTGYSCSGSVSCSQFTSSSTCGDYGTCTWDNSCENAIALDRIDSSYGGVVCNDNASCTWTCDSIAEEICSDGIDNDGNGLVDCMDPACQKGSWTNAEVDSYNCLGTYQTADLTYSGSDPYYCAVSETDASVGLCCPVGQKLEYRPSRSEWSCVDTDPCLAPSGYCDYKYGVDPLSSWLGDSDCVSPSEPSACCSVVLFGSEEYWSDTGNVKVY